MISILDDASAGRALRNTDLDVELRALLGLRLWEIRVEHDLAWSTDTRVFVVVSGDPPDVINAALGFAITGDHANPPPYEFLKDHGLWFEIAFETGIDGITLIFVENGPGTELGIHYLCIAHFWTDVEEGVC